MVHGLFLGRELTDAGQPLGAPLMLDPRDLLTHGLIVGMTGSGKTGLAIALIEEVLRSGVPVLAIDPKGDLGNLLLLLDDFGGESHEAWIPPEQARRAGKSMRDLSQEVASAWERGMNEWGLHAADVRRLREAHEALILTPGSRMGTPLNIMSSLAGPTKGVALDAEDYQDELVALATGLLGLVGRDADPFGRDAVFLGHTIDAAWRSEMPLTLERLVEMIARPPFDKVGALPVEAVYPTKDRERLMLDVNNLLAAPGFAVWTEGVPLEIEGLLRSADGRPRLSIVSTAHLAEEERQFATALVLNKLKTWVRRQSGTGDLRLLVYVDEIFGYVPPHPANPPTKGPVLTLLKQARAQGVGVVLATQNPVDLDYKGLSNMGVWIVGRLQTDQDRERLQDGLQSAGGDRESVRTLLAQVRKRVFLLHDVHRAHPTVFHSRHTLSFLRGPLSSADVERLMAGRRVGLPQAGSAETPHSAAPAVPVLPAPWKAHFLSRFDGDIAAPHLFVQYIVKYKGRHDASGLRAYPLPEESGMALLEGDFIEISRAELRSDPVPGVRCSEPPAWLARLGARGVERLLRERLPDKLTLRLLADPITRVMAAPGEDRAAFEARVALALEDHPQTRKIRDRIERKRRELGAREQDLSGRRTEKWLALGSALLANVGLLTGRRRRVTGASTVLSKERMENNAETRVATLEAEIRELEDELAHLSATVGSRLVEEVLAPSRSGLRILRYDIVWVS